MSISDFAVVCPIVLWPAPPAHPTPVLLPQVHASPAPAPPATLPRVGPSSQLAARVAGGNQIKQLRFCRSSSFASTAATPLSPEDSATESNSEEEMLAGAPSPFRARAGLPQVDSSLIKDLRVRNTFFELPIELEDDHRPGSRSSSAPPLGRVHWLALRSSNTFEAPAEAALTDDVPSVGSRMHAAQTCKPCAFVHTVQGCNNGRLCQFCHSCDSEEKKRRQKTRWEEKRTAWRLWRKQERRQAAMQRQTMLGHQQ